MSIHYRVGVTPFSDQHLQAIAKVLADTDNGLTGSQIGHLLETCHIPDVDPLMTKWKRLFNAFVVFQNRHRVGNHVVVFINNAMDPASYTSQPEVFECRKTDLNAILALCGMTIGDDGRVRVTTKVSSLNEALERANRFQATMRQRNVHADVYKYCSAEILQRNYFHAVFEAMKSITVKIRTLSGLTSDGAELVDQAFGLGKTCNPILAINALNTETLQGEQKGFASLLKGLYGTIRNPLSHEPKIEWNMTEQDALDIMTMISLIHRKLDGVKRYQRPTTN